MMFNIIVLILLSVHGVYLRHNSEQPVAKQIWQERCARNEMVLNDCNWCKCNVQRQFKCTARICSQVDIFGHFNDAIQHMDVGMEGHGVWRSATTNCDSGVHYQKDDVLCVCAADGKWPNAVCRDMFQILHTVIPTNYTEPNNQTCTPRTLYQIGCNTCICPSGGIIDSSMCTTRNCSKDISETVANTDESKNDTLNEIYAMCERGKAYQIGCKTCVCLPNNRLLCDNCTDVDNIKSNVHLKNQDKKNSLCSNKSPGEPFKKNCNICHCDKNDVLYCTVLKCLEANTRITQPLIDFETVDPPVDDNDCEPGTEYNKDCNTCTCFKFEGVKYFGCTMKKCENGERVENDVDGCVEGTKYEKNCLICHCVKEKGVSKEYCTFNKECKTDKEFRSQDDGENSLEDLHGYCEPLHVYKQDCNKCKCLTDGKRVACTSEICKSAPPKPMVVEFIPFIQKKNICPRGHKYKVDCNFCQCLSNGNAICTTRSCRTGLNTI